MNLYKLIPYFQTRNDLISFIRDNDELFVEEDIETYDVSPYLAWRAYLHLRDKTCEGFAVDSTQYGYFNSEYQSKTDAKEAEFHLSFDFRNNFYSIDIGIVASLNSERTEALILSPSKKTHTFSSKIKFDLKVGDFVVYCYDRNGTKSECIPLKKFEIVDDHNNSYKCPNGLYCSETAWFAYKKGIPFFSISGAGSPCVCFPIEKNINKNIYIMHSLGYSNYFFRLIQRTILIPRILYTDLHYEAKFLADLRKYIDSYNYKKIINTYKIEERGYIKYRVGKDNMYIVTTRKSIQTSDLYIQSLLPIGTETDVYDYYGSEHDYSFIDESSTKENRSRALSLYNKEEHFAFLVSNFYNTYTAVKEDLKEADSLLKDYFGYTSFVE